MKVGFVPRQSLQSCWIELLTKWHYFVSQWINYKLFKKKIQSTKKGSVQVVPKGPFVCGPEAKSYVSTCQFNPIQFHILHEQHFSWLCFYHCLKKSVQSSWSQGDNGSPQRSFIKTIFIVFYYFFSCYVLTPTTK